MRGQIEILFDEHLRFNRIVDEFCAIDPYFSEVLADILKVMIRHEQMEEELVFPLYNSLIDRLSNNTTSTADDLGEKYVIFMKSRTRLIEDHNIMKKVLCDVRGRAHRIDYITAIDEMLNHMRLEEELLYPAVAVLWKFTFENVTV